MRSLGIELLARADLFVENRNRGWRSTIAPADSHRRVHPMFNCLLQATHSDPRLIWPHPIPPSQRARVLTRPVWETNSDFETAYGLSHQTQDRLIVDE